MNSLQIDEVKAIHAANVARKDPPQGWDPRQSTRVHVHEELQRRNPMPCTSITPEMQAARDRRTPMTHVEKAAQVAHQLAQVTEEQHEAHGRAKATRDPDHVTTKDAHHFVQKEHGKALWTETDRLVGEAVPS